MMYQAKISLTEPLAEFLADHKTYGFKDKSTMVRTALARFKCELETQTRRESAALYAELYESDSDQVLFWAIHRYAFWVSAQTPPPGSQTAQVPDSGQSAQGPELSVGKVWQVPLETERR